MPRKMFADGFAIFRSRPVASLLLLLLVTVLPSIQFFVPLERWGVFLAGVLRTLVMCYAAALGYEKLKTGEATAKAIFARGKSLFGRIIVIFIAFGALLGAVNLLLSLFGTTGSLLSALLEGVKTVFLLYCIACALNVDLTQALLDAFLSFGKNKLFFLTALLLILLLPLAIFFALMSLAPDSVAPPLGWNVTESVVLLLCLYALVARRHGATPEEAPGEIPDQMPGEMPEES